MILAQKDARGGGLIHPQQGGLAVVSELWRADGRHIQPAMLGAGPTVWAARR